jgi:uncharacterized phage-associated protein
MHNKETKLLKEVVKAWESLPVDKNYSPRVIADWLLNDVSPVIDKVRIHLKKQK